MFHCTRTTHSKYPKYPQIPTQKNIPEKKNFFEKWSRLQLQKKLGYKHINYCWLFFNSFLFLRIFLVHIRCVTSYNNKHDFVQWALPKCRGVNSSKQNRNFLSVVSSTWKNTQREATTFTDICAYLCILVPTCLSPNCKSNVQGPCKPLLHNYALNPSNFECTSDIMDCIISTNCSLASFAICHRRPLVQ